MGIIAAPSKVLVTGANGYIAMWIINLLLNAGYSVRGSVRKLEKSKDLASRFSNFVETGKLEFVIVEDMTVDGAFDDAVKDVDGIIHTASPVTIKVELPEDLIKPAVAGALGVLKSSLNFGNKLKRIIMTSTTGTIFAPVTQPTVRDETNWNDTAVEEVERLGKDATPIYKYMTSKVRAERAFWEFYEAHKNDVPWDVAVIHPPIVLGPALNNFKTPSDLTESTTLWWSTIIATPPTPASAGFASNWVDVRDLSRAHILALQAPSAGGERMIVSAGPFMWQDWFDIAATHRSPLRSHEFPHHKEFGGYLPKGCPEIERKRLLVYNTAKAQKILGPELTYRTKEETTRDILEDYAARGW